MDVDYHSTVYRLFTGAPPALTVPLCQYWYLSHAFRKELSQIENEFGVEINAEVSVSVTAVDQIRGDSVNKATQRVTDLVQNSMKSLQCVKIPHTQVESEIVKEVVRNIRMDRAKMMINMSADQCLLFGPEPVISGVEEQMNLEPGMKLKRSFISSTLSKAEVYRDLRKEAGNAKEKKRVKSKDDDCPICMDKFTDKQKLKCGHEFCKECLEASVKCMGEICPLCKDIFGMLTGTQPDGKMSVSKLGSSLPGYSHCGTIQITYNIPDGTQTVRIHS
ncbi:E3 ubiquitin-protein ligase DTX4-like [Colossoma macropomum]|uniref:E3 ubiquitin-protein ligase DTX4-like n=1 Tax=Colossoma macropomum TaxID=42526 RepID=UPI001863F095|nr:E3 ubiquitin-protein ligase DTX4-like [Colossoma macropomum]